jgi:DNA-binding CsgD family transcriptional regulator
VTYSTTTKDLSPRERQILALWMQRMEHQTIADRLSTPEKIVKKGYINKTLDAIQWKRDMISRKELRTWALENGFDKVEDANQSWQSEQEHLRYQGE